MGFELGSSEQKASTPAPLDHHNGTLRITQAIDAVNQGNWSLSIKLRLECFVIVA